MTKKRKKNGAASQSSIGIVTEKLRSRILEASNQKVLPLKEIAAVRQELEKQLLSFTSPEEMFKSGIDPLFALYSSIGQLISFYSEFFLMMPELKRFEKELKSAEEDYVPDFPPMSPITKSYFFMWTTCDLRIGSNQETLAGLIATLGKLLGLNEETLSIVRNLSHSRMGIYEHCGLKDGKILLQELVTNREFLFVENSGYPGKRGELWFVRTAPPPQDILPYHVAVMTPYILQGAKREDWIAYFERNDIRSGELGSEKRLERLLKFGPSPRYWSEFIFEGYSNYHPGAVFLAGLPDIPESRPHSGFYNPRKLANAAWQ